MKHKPAHELLPVVILTIPTITASVWSSKKNQNISVKPPAPEQTSRLSVMLIERRQLSSVVQQVIFCDIMIELS